MSVIVIDRFKRIDIHNDDGKGLAAALKLLPFAGEGLIEEAPVIKARERIADGHLIEFAIFVFELPDILLVFFLCLLFRRNILCDEMDATHNPVFPQVWIAMREQDSYAVRHV